MLGLVGGRGGGEEHSARLEELLEVERERNRQLSDRLDSLEKGGMVGQVVAEEQVPVVKEGNEEGEVGQHTTSPDFPTWQHSILHEGSSCGIMQREIFRLYVIVSGHSPTGHS